MSPYALTVFSLLFAILAQGVATVVALRVVLRQPYRRAWLALAIASGLLALHHGHTLELALFSGLYDPPQGVLSALVSTLLTLGLFGLRREIRQP